MDHKYIVDSKRGQAYMSRDARASSLPIKPNSAEARKRNLKRIQQSKEWVLHAMSDDRQR